MGAITAGGVEKRLIVGVPEQLVAYRRQHLVRIIVAHVKRQVAINALDWARLDERTGATGADTVVESFSSKFFNKVADLRRGRLGLFRAIFIPKLRDVL